MGGMWREKKPMQAWGGYIETRCRKLLGSGVRLPKKKSQDVKDVGTQEPNGIH